MSLPEGTTLASAGVRPVTVTIHEDELAFWLVELNLVRAPSRQWHRWQVVTVNRNDILTDWWHDLGPQENFPGVPPLAIPGLFEEPVANLRDLAEQQRHSDRFSKRKAELEAESTLIPDLLNQYEEGKRIRRNVSSFGPAVTHQRNGLDQRALDELSRSS